MKFRQRNTPQSAGYSLTSMLDVIFLLLCFFITTAVFSQWECEVDITLPTSKTAKPPERLPGEVILNIAQDGKVSVNQQELSPGVLKTRLARLVKYYPGQPVILRADASAPVEKLVAVIDICREAEVWNFSIATQDRKPEEPVPPPVLATPEQP